VSTGETEIAFPLCSRIGSILFEMFSEAITTLTAKPDKDIRRKKTYRLVYHTNIDKKVFNKTLAKPI
jgi:hypothetical protein